MLSPLSIEVDADLTRAQAGATALLAAGEPCHTCDVGDGSISNCILIIASQAEKYRMQTASCIRVVLNARSIM